MRPFGATETAAALVLFSAVASAEAAEGHPFLPYRYNAEGNKINYTPTEIVDIACEKGKLDKLQAHLRRRGLDLVGLDCAETRQYFTEHAQATLCKDHEQGGRIITENYTLKGDLLRPLVRECYANELSYQITDTRGAVRAELLSSCANLMVLPDFMGRTAEREPALHPGKPLPSVDPFVCPPGDATPLRGRGGIPVPIPPWEMPLGAGIPSVYGGQTSICQVPTRR